MTALEVLARRSHVRAMAFRRVARRAAAVRQAARRGRGAFLLAVAAWEEAHRLYGRLPRP